MFQKLFSMMSDGQLLTVNLLRHNGKFVISVLPQSPHVEDNAKSQIIPLNLTGTPEELDEGFIAAIATPIQKASGILLNLAQYEEKAEKAASESKALKEKTDKINKSIKDAGALEAERPREALLAYKKILAQDKYNSKVIDKIKSLEKKLSEGSLFGAEDTMTIVEVSTDKQPAVIEVAVTQEQPVVVATQPQSAADDSLESSVNATAMPPADMFEQAVSAADKPSGDISADKVNTALVVDPAMFSQFQQFMAMQQGQKQTQQ